MATELLPAIGASGVWRLRAPFDTKIIAGLAYSCKAIRKISETVGTGVDAKAEYYDKYELSEAVYNADAAADISIITLLSSSGNWLFVPSTYLIGWPNGDAIPYVVMGMAANLGAIPNTIDPTFLTSIVKNAIVAALGHEPEIDYFTLSEVTNKTFAEHEALEAHRLSLIDDDNSDYARRVIAENNLARAAAQIAALEQFIVDNHIGP